MGQPPRPMRPHKKDSLYIYKHPYPISGPKLSNQYNGAQLGGKEGAGSFENHNMLCEILWFFTLQNHPTPPIHPKANFLVPPLQYRVIPEFSRIQVHGVFPLNIMAEILTAMSYDGN